MPSQMSLRSSLSNTGANSLALINLDMFPTPLGESSFRAMVKGVVWMWRENDI